MNNQKQISFSAVGSTIIAHCERALLLEDSLVISDIHFGKVNHFRKAGIAIPAMAVQANFDRLTQLILEFQPKRVAFLGDFFHSKLNAEWHLVDAFLNQSDFNCEWILVEGNHDILDANIYEKTNLSLVSQLKIGNCILTHEPLETVPENRLNIHGHIHPGIRLTGKAKQGISLPCFHLSKTHMCMPAFGELTGLKLQKKGKTDRVFAITSERIFEVT